MCGAETGVLTATTFNMGNDIDSPNKAIKAITVLAEEGKDYLSHHIRNSLQVIMYAAGHGNYKEVIREVEHMAADLKRVGL